MILENDTQHVTIVRKALLSAAKSWKMALWILANSSKTDSVRLKDALWRIKSKAFTILKKSKDEFTRINAIRFIEIIAMTLTSNDNTTIKRKPTTTSGSGSGNAIFESLRDAPLGRHHSLPSLEILVQEGFECLTALADRAKDEKEKITIKTAAFTSLATVARLRDTAREIAVDCLSTCVSYLERTNAVASPFAQTLKGNGVLLLKACVPDEKSMDSPYLIKLTQALTTLNADEHLKRHVAPLEKKKIAADNAAEELKRKLKEYPPQTNAFPTEGLHMLPIETLARLLVDNAKNVPNVPPPGHQPQRPSELLGPTGLPPRLERVMALIRAVETGRGLKLPPQLENCHAPQNITPPMALEQRKQAFLRVVTAATESSEIAARLGAHGWGPKSYETCGVVSARLACDFEATEFKDGELRESLIDELLSRTQGGTEDAIAAIAALHVEFSADRIPKPNNDQMTRAEPRYETFLNALVSKMIAGDLGNKTVEARLNNILCEAPSLPKSTLKMIFELCEQPASYVIGLRLIRDVIMARASSRDVCVNAVLRFAMLSESKELRETSVRLTGNRLYKGVSIKTAEKISIFAFACFRSLDPGALRFEDVVCDEAKHAKHVLDSVLGRPFRFSTPLATASLMATPSPEVEQIATILSRIQLFVALCASDTALLPKLLDGYAFYRAGTSLASVAVENLEDARKRQLKIMDAIHTQTDLLWESYVTTLQTPVRAISLFHDFPPGAEDLVLRAVSTFAKRDPDSVVLTLSMLRPRGGKPCHETDARFLVPVIGSLDRDAALQKLTRIATQCRPEDVRQAISNIVNGTVGRTIAASELLLCLANLQTEDVKALVSATDALLDQRAMVTENVLRKVFFELVEQDVYPKILMRILIKGFQNFPGLKIDCLEILGKLIDRNVWTLGTDLWEGFQHFTKLLVPESLKYVLRLPDQVLEGYMNTNAVKIKNLKLLMRNAALADAELMGKDAAAGGGDTSMSEEGGAEEAGGGGGVEEDDGQPDTRAKTQRSRVLTPFAKQLLGL